MVALVGVDDTVVWGLGLCGDVFRQFLRKDFYYETGSKSWTRVRIVCLADVALGRTERCRVNHI